MKLSVRMIFCVLLFNSVLPAGVYQARPFDLKQVRLVDGPFKDAMERNRQYLLSLDSDRLLHNFRLTANLPTSAKPLGGWEWPKHNIRGCFMGHYLSACALMYASTGDEMIKAKVNYIIAELSKCQQSQPDHYLGGFSQITFDEIDAGLWSPGTPGGPVPWYKMHKVLAGLYDVYFHCENEWALEILKNLATWAKNRTDKLSQEQLDTLLMIEFGGMNDAFYNLYSVTGDPDHLIMAKRFDHEWLYGPLANKQDNLTALHANSTLPKFVGAVRRYELTGEERYRDITQFFWNQIRDRYYVTGGNSRDEAWQQFPNMLANELGTETEEFCCTYNMLKITRHLFSWAPDICYADYYEQALINHILVSQNRRTGMIDNKVSLNHGDRKYFCPPLDSFNCCLGSGCESFAKLADSIYFHNDGELYVNLFMASQLNWSEKGLTLRQETNFPEQQTTRFAFSLSDPLDLTLHIRVPYWLKTKPDITINGKPAQTFLALDGYQTLKRTWGNGARLELTLPMNLHTYPMPDDESFVAIMYGPLVLFGLTESGQPQNNIPDTEKPFFSTPYFVTESDNLTDWIKPVPGKPLTFVTTGQTKNFTLVPFHKVIDEKYGVYWRLYCKNGKQHADYLSLEQRRKERLSRTIDFVELNNNKSESQHKIQLWNYAYGQREGRGFRYTRPGGGGFSYELAVLPDKPVTLSCTYWADNEGHLYDIFVNDQKIATQLATFIDADYHIPEELTRGKGHITVKFQDAPDSLHAPLFDCRTLSNTTAPHSCLWIQKPRL